MIALHKSPHQQAEESSLLNLIVAGESQPGFMPTLERGGPVEGLMY